MPPELCGVEGGDTSAVWGGGVVTLVLCAGWRGGDTSAVWGGGVVTSAVWDRGVVTPVLCRVR